MPEVLTCLENSKNLEPESQTASATPETAVSGSLWQEATTSAIAVFQRHTLQDLLEKGDESQRSNPMYYL